MLLKAQILERFISGVNRFFKVNLFSRQTVQPVQFHSGGDDYNPPANCEGLCGTIGDNPANSVIFSWRDNVHRKSRPGEKRIYAVNAADGTVCGELYLRNDGNIEMNGSGELKMVINGNVSLITQGDANISAANVNIAAGATSLGVGGQPIARLNDEITVEITSGSSAGTYKGKISSAGVNTSI